MTVFADFYDVVKWIHISAVVVGFGSTFAYGVIIATAMKSHPRSVPGVIAGISQNSRTLVSAGGLLVLITGVYLLNDRWDNSDFFGAFGFVAVVVLLGMTHTVFRKNEEAATKAAERDIEQSGGGDVKWSPEFEKANVTLSRFGALAGLIIIVTIYVMVDKPFL